MIDKNVIFKKGLKKWGGGVEILCDYAFIPYPNKLLWLPMAMQTRTKTRSSF